jgi:hypothetical protein
MKMDVFLTPPPDSVDGVFSDRFFRRNLYMELECIKNHGRVVLKEGQKFRRTPYDTLREMGILNTSSVVAEYINIKQKTSKLPAGCRCVLSYIVAKATRKMYDTYRQINCMT